MFVALSGLHVNPTKSHLILSKSAQHNRDRLLGVLGFQEGHLPVRYLGLPLIASRRSLSNWGFGRWIPKGHRNQVCRPIEEGDQGIQDILAINIALISRHLWRIIQENHDSIWVNWIYHVRLQGKSIWTVNDCTGSWGWCKLL
ncbi:UNVERIFIED_CONTAM: hypothetical protein Sradi_0708200 [Sesamum radiatum]|uniref:Uncharacterized protein n=1 Tax=Sesamum radiatum TaxID=300843 RepID=A0AAW2VNI2_SESRA